MSEHEIKKEAKNSAQVMEKEYYEQLKQTIDRHMDLYYNHNTNEISDYEYDQLMLELKAIEKEHPQWVTKDSPTQKIGGVARPV